MWISLWINPVEAVGRLPAGKPLCRKAFSDIHRIVENALVALNRPRMGARPQIGVTPRRTPPRCLRTEIQLFTTSVVSGGVEHLFVVAIVTPPCDMLGRYAILSSVARMCSRGSSCDHGHTRSFARAGRHALSVSSPQDVRGSRRVCSHTCDAPQESGGHAPHPTTRIESTNTCVHIRCSRRT